MIRGSDEFMVASGGVVRPEEPKEAVDQIYCIYYEDGEMTISQNEIEPEIDRMVVKKGFYEKPSDCTNKMTNVRFLSIVKPKSCAEWFNKCNKLTVIKNIENLNTNECTDMSYMFWGCFFLKNIDVSGFITNKVTDMFGMFAICKSLISIDLSHFDTSNVTNMSNMFTDCTKLTNLDLSIFDTKNVVNMSWMFASCESLTDLNLSEWNINNVDVENLEYMLYMFSGYSSLQTKGIKVSQATYNKLMTVSNLGISADKFDIVK